MERRSITEKYNILGCCMENDDKKESMKKKDDQKKHKKSMRVSPVMLGMYEEHTFIDRY